MAARHAPTLADVAREAGVSVTTVSRVLNDRGYLGQQTKDRVADAIKKIGYRPNQAARSLLGKPTHIIGLVVPTVALPFFGELATGVDDALAAHGYRTLVCNSLGKEDRERELLDMLVGSRVDGIISGAHNEHLAEYAGLHLPLVAVDRSLAAHVPIVRCDNESGGYLATDHLLARGARRPALLTSRSGPFNLREAGYRRRVAEAGGEPVIAAIEFHTDDAERRLRTDAWLDEVADRIDAVFATDDLAAASVLDWARRRGRRVPEDFKVIGFDGTAAMRRAVPELTTIAQPLADIAQVAVDLLLAQINGQQALEDQMLLPVELVQGRST